MLQILDKDKQGYQQLYRINQEIKELIIEGGIYE
jgi:hypothetical protein